MLGDTIREQRIRKGLTQARLARLAGVSRRHLAALEKGANVSVLVLRKVASVLDLTEIHLGDLSLRASDQQPPVNVALLTDTLREARTDALRVNATLARAEGILTGDAAEELAAVVPDGGIIVRFPIMPVRHLESVPDDVSADVVRDRSGWRDVQTAGELRQGQPVDETKQETVVLPETLLENGEIVFRVRGDELRDQGIEDGDLLIVELRPRGRAANGELVIGRIAHQVYVGRWWQKHGRKALMSDGLSEVTVGRSRRALKVVAAVNQIVRRGG